MSENNSYSYEWPFLKNEDGFRTWMSVLGKEERDFLLPFPLWRASMKCSGGKIKCTECPLKWEAVVEVPGFMGSV